MNYEDARNSLPFGADTADDAANIIPELAAAAATVGRGAIPLLVNADNVVTLPPGVSLDDIQVRGRDLVIEMPDGRVFVIADGAVFVPTIVADGVAIPPLNLAAYLNSSEVQPAAGTPQSSGGNFADPNDPLQPAFGLGDLLPYTELSFPQPQDEEVIPGLVNRQPAIIFVPEIGEGTEVREAHLPATTPTRQNESPGSQFDGNAETTSNVIRFVSPDGVESIRINGVVLTPGSFPQVVASDATGTLTITGYTFDPATNTGTISYTYTLNDNTVAPEGSDVTFPIVVTDPQGDSATDDLIIDIIDDVPEAFDNTNSVSEGGTATGNVLTDQVDDIFGADGPAATAPAGGVVGVRPAGGDTTTEVIGGTGTQIAGLYGTLTLNANGTYTYVAKPNFINVNVSEVFVYTIEDGDGDRSTAKLTIDIGAVGGSSSDNDARVDESGLDGIGSQLVPNGEFFTGGQITVTGATGPFTYTLTSPADGTYGNLVLNAATGAYSYTLDTPFDEPDANNGRDTINDAETFGYEVTDQFGNIVGTGTIDIDIVDDVPTAFPNFNSVAEGGTVGGDVLLDQGADVFGADGRATTNPAGGVIGVRAANGDTTTHVVGGTGTQIAGLHGTLTLNANGTYSYTANANLAGSGLEDLFVYTIQDGDGDRSTTTLRISIDEINLVADNDRVVTREDALDLFQTGADLAPGTVTGSDPGSTLESVSGALSVAGATAFSLVSPATGTYGLIQLNPNGTYTYTLTRRVDNLPHANDGKEVELAREVFTYQAADANGNTVQGTITVDIVDDTPIARPDSNAVDEGGFVSGEVLPNDAWGADGPDGGVIGVRAANGNFSTPVSGGLETTIQGLYGTLVMGADGEYDYQAGSVDADVTDVFVYTIRDRDGDLSTTTLSIRITNIEEPPPPEHVPPRGGDIVALTVLEAALDEEATGNDIAPGSVVGSTPVETTETDVAPNELTFTAGTDAFTSIGFALVAQQTISVAGLEPGFSITWVLNSGVLIGTLVDGVTPVGEAIRLQLSDNTGPFAAGGTSNVTVTATLTGPLEHVNLPAGQGNVVISGIRVVTAEADGQSVDGTATVTVIDDVPLINVVDNDATDNDIVTVIEGGSTNGVWTLNPGADGVTTVDVTVGDDTQTLDLSDSSDEAVFNLAAGDLTVGADGTWSFIANTNLTQPVSVSFTLSAVDGDNDPTTDTLTIDIDDGGSPSVSGKAELVLYESGLDTGAPGSGDDDSLDIAPGSVEGTLPDQTTETEVHSNAITYTAGSDDITSIGFAAGASQAPTVSGLEPGYSLTWTNSGTSLLIGTLIGPGNTNLGEAIRVELSGAALSGITAGGSGSITVKATLTGPLEHDYNAILQGPVTIEGLEIVSAEADLESKSGFIDITVHDDNPIMTLEDASVPDLITDDDDVDVPGSHTKDFSGLFSWIAGADGYDGGTEASGVVFSLSVTGFVANTTFPDSGLDDVATGKNVLLRVNGSGTIDGFIDNGNTTTTVVFTIAVSNTPGATWGDVTLTQLRAIKHDNPNDPDEDVGAGAEQMTNVADGLIKLTATITDGDKDTDSESVDITGAFNFEDDGPTAVDDTDTVASGTTGPATGNVITGNDILVGPDSNTEDGNADSAGTDGGARVVFIDNDAVNPSDPSDVADTSPAKAVPGGGSVSIDGQYGTLTIWSNGDYSYVRNVGQGGGQTDSFTYTIVDADGDMATAKLDILIEDAEPEASTVTVLLDDDVLTGGIDNDIPSDDDPDPVVTFPITTNLIGTGGDPDLRYELTDTVTPTGGATGLTYELSGAPADPTQQLLIKQGSETIVTITLTKATGAIEVTQNNNLLHSDDAANEENNQVFDITYKVIDADGDEAAPAGTLKIDIDDDTPIADDDSFTQTSEGAQVSGNVTVNDEAGADGEGGAPGPVQLVANSLSGGTGTLVLNANGTFTYDATAGEDADVSFQYTYTDGDGDTDTATVTIDLQPDAGITANDANAYVDDDGFNGEGTPAAFGNPNGDAGGANGDNDQNNVSEGAPASTDERIWAGTLSATAADGVSKYSLASATGSGTVGTENVTLTYSVTAGVGTLLATVSAAQTRSGTQLFKVELTEATGAYTVTLLNPVMHADNGDTENNTSIALTFTASDGDPTPDTDTATLTIDFDDDMVSAFDPADVSFANDGNFTSAATDLDLGGHIGADGLGSIVFFDDYGPDNLLRTTGGTLVTSGGLNITLSGLGTGVLTGSTTAGTVFTITLNGPNDTYIVNVQGILDDGSGRFLSDTSGVRSGASNFNVLDVPSTTEDILVAAFERGSDNSITQSTVNTATTGIGVGSQSIGDGGAIIFDFVSGPTVTNSSNNVYDYPTSPGHYPVNNFSFAITQKNAGGVDSIEIWVRAYNGDNVDPSGTNAAAQLSHLNELRDDGQVLITEIRVNDVVVPLGTLTPDGSGGYLVTGLDLNDRITVSTLNGYNRLELENAISLDSAPNAALNGESFDIGQLGFVSVNQGNDIVMGFDLTLTDKDGDAITVNNAILLTSTPSGAPVPPIVLDLDGDGTEFLSLDAGVTYNYGFGLVATAWVGADDGLLARQTASGLDVVFADDAPGAATDLEGLRLAHDSNADGVFDASDVSFGQFGVWRDANSDGVVDAGEFTSLAGAGISAINLASDGKAGEAANGDVTIHGMGTFVRADGSIGRLADVSFAISAERANTRSIEFAGVAAAAGAISALTAPVLLASDNDGPAAGTDDLGLGDGGSSAPAGAQDDADLADISARLQSNLEASSARNESTGTAGGEDGEGPAGLYDAGDDNDAAPASAGAADADNPAVGPDASLFAGDTSGMEAMNALLTMAPVNSAPEADAAPDGLGALQEAVAEAGQESLAEQLVAQFASADDGAGPPMSGTDLAKLLAINLSDPDAGSMPAYDMNQQLADEAHALAAAG